MIGAGSAVFALMGYVIANMRPDKQVGAQVRLNPKLLSAIIGDPEPVIQSAIDFLCAPDSKTTTPGDDGRRLVKVGTFDYRVVNAVKYQAMKNEEERREKNRVRQKEHRDGKKPVRLKRSPLGNGSLPGEVQNEALLKAGATQEQLDANQTASLPEGLR